MIVYTIIVGILLFAYFISLTIYLDIKKQRRVKNDVKICKKNRHSKNV